MTNDKLITELLDQYTDNKRIQYSEVGDMSDNYKAFKNRYSFYKDYLSRELPDFTFEELIKIHSNFNKLKDILYAFQGFDLALTILEREVNTEEFEGVLKRNRINSNDYEE